MQNVGIELLPFAVANHLDTLVLGVGSRNRVGQAVDIPLQAIVVDPDPGFTPPNDSVAGDLQALNSPSPASANSPQTMALLKALLESSIAE